MVASAGPHAGELLQRLQQAVAQHPSLTARQLAAVVRGQKHPATADEVLTLLEARPDIFEWAGDPPRWATRPQPDPVEGQTYNLPQLADVFGATADVLLRVLRVWSESGQTPGSDFAADAFSTLTNGGATSLADSDLEELRARAEGAADPPPGPAPRPPKTRPQPPAPPAPPTPPPVSKGRWNRLPGAVLALQVTTPRTRGERDLFAALCRVGKLLLVSGYAIQGQNGREVETDALIVSPHGVFTVEQKDTRGAGVLDVPVNGPPTLNGVALTKTANARSQARRQAQALATQLREPPAVELGFIIPILCISGQVTLAAEASGEVLLATPQTIATTVRAAAKRPTLAAADVTDALRRLRLPAVEASDLALLGFATRRT